MAVRVPLRLRSAAGRVVDTVAILNGGFEVEAPHLLLPVACAERLFPGFRSHAVSGQFVAAGETPLSLMRVRETASACVLAGKKEGPVASLHVLVSETEREALVSDLGIDALRIRIESFGPGRWRLENEKRIRKTSKPRYW